MSTGSTGPGRRAIRVSVQLAGALLGTSLAGHLGTALGALAGVPLSDLLASEDLADTISKTLGASAESVTANIWTSRVADELRKLETSRDAALNEDLARALITALRDAVAELSSVPPDMMAAWQKRFAWSLEDPARRRDFFQEVASDVSTPGEWDRNLVGRLHRPEELVNWLWASVRRELESSAVGAGCATQQVRAVLDRSASRDLVVNRLQSVFGKVLLTDEPARKKLQYYMSLVLLGRLDRQDRRQIEISQMLEAAFDALPDQIADRVVDRITADQRLPRKIAEELQRDRFSIRKRLVFYRPGIATNSPFRLAFKPFYFAEKEDKFVGRKGILAELGEGLLEARSGATGFRWAAICGDAGSGKSRLAFQVLETEASRWPLSGFVRSGFLKETELKPGDLAAISAPTLFVIDYAGSDPERCCRFIERCALLAEDAPFPVRAIVLLRRSNDRFFEAVARGDDGAVASRTQVVFPPPPERGDDTSGALFLGSLSDSETRQLMRSRIERSRRVRGRTEGSEDLDEIDLLAMLRRYDNSQRPLFAVMVADAFARGMLPGETGGNDDQEEARLTLFWDYLDHQFKKRWSIAPDGTESVTSREQVDRHLSFLTLSTMCRGLTPEAWYRLVSDPKLGRSATAILPRHPEDFDSAASARPSADFDEEHLLATLSGSIRNEPAGPYPILEPDLVGEALVLLILERKKKALCRQPITADHRRRFLREYAWVADPEGAAFFSVLTTQDFPERAARQDWLLPAQPREDAALERARLFKSLVLTTIAPLQTRAATRDDVTRMEALVDRFPAAADAPVKVSRERAAAVSELAAELVFIINKSITPSRTARESVIADKLGKHPITFGQVADGFQRAARLRDSDDGQAIFRLTSDTDTVAAALVLLRRFYDEVADSVLADGDFELRRLQAETVCHALSGVFWDHRNDSSKYGFAAGPLTEEESEARESLAIRCRERMRSGPVDQYSVAIVSLVYRLIIYAEHGVEPTRGSDAFAAIQSIQGKKGFSEAKTISAALKFLENYAFLRVHTPKQVGKGKDEENELDSLVPVEISKVADALVRAVWEIDEIPESVRMRIIDAWSQVGSHLAFFKSENGSSVLADLEDLAASHLEFLERIGSSPVTNSVVNLYNVLFDACHREGGPLDEIVKRYASLVQDNHFDPVSMNYQYWDNLRHHYWQLRRCGRSSWSEVQSIIETAIRQVGDRARRDLEKMLLGVLPGSDSVLERDSWLAAQALGPDGTHAARTGARKLRVALMAQHLLNGDEGAAAEQLEMAWRHGAGEDTEHLERRTEALAMLRVLVLWHGHAHPHVSPWRRHLLDLVTPSLDKLPSSAARRAHNQASIETAACFARLEVHDGLPYDDWLPRG